MNHRDELDLLDQVQAETEETADGMEWSTGLDRRRFVFLSLVAAAASTFGLGASVVAQGTAPAPQAAPPAPPAPPLGNGEPVSWTFQPYPGGTGALMEKLIKERGAAAFERASFVPLKWTGTVPTSPEDIAFQPAHRLSVLLKEKRITSVQLTRIYLDRIERLDPTLLCAVTIMREQALAEASRADAEITAGRYRGPLHGIPYGVKDLFSTKGVRTTWGSKDFENRVIDEDAEIVVRLRNAGAVLMAKLASGLFAQGDQWYRGRTNNPWDIRRGSSGSSAGPSSATAAGCVAFGIGTETSGSIVSPARECGLSALRPTFGRVSRYGGMVLAWSQDRVGPICRTVEDCAMVFNAIHGVDPKDPGTITTPFEFDRNIKLASVRIGVDAAAPKEFVDTLKELGARPTELAARPGGGGGGLGVESAAAFDSYVQWKAKELNIDLATIPEPPQRGAGAGGGAGRGRGGADAAAGAAGGGAAGAGAAGAAGGDAGAGAGAAPGAGRGRGGDPGNPTGMAALTRWTNGRFPRAFDFVNQQRRRYAQITQMAELLKNLDMYVPGNGYDVGLHASTGHPCVVVPYKFEAPPAGRGGGGGGRAAGAAGAADPAAAGREAPPAPPAEPGKPQPICAVLAGNLYNDDKILSVAHQYQIHTTWHLKHPTL
jgi:hypothetical protein